MYQTDAFFKQLIIVIMLLYYYTTALKDRAGITGNTRPQFSTFLSNRSTHCTTLHLTLIINNHTRTILKMNKHALLPSETLALSHNNSGHDLFSQLRLSLLHRNHDHVSRTSFGETVESASDVAYGNDVKVFSAGVVGAVDYCGDGETGRDTVFDS